MKKKIIIAAIVIIIIGIIAAISIIGWKGLKAGDKSSKNDEQAFVMSVGEITGTGLASTLNRFSGVVEPQETLKIQLGSDKTVKEILVEEGQEVEVGTPLYIYDTEKAEDELAQAELEIERIDNDILNAGQKIKELEKEKKEASADQQLSYTTEIQTTQTEVKRSEYEKKSKEVTIEQLKKTIEKSTVTSEIKGVVKSINNPSDSSQANMNGEQEPFMSILTLGDFRIKGKVNEQNMGFIMEGQPVIVYSRVNDDVWTGVLNKLDVENPETNDNSGMGYGMPGGGESQTTSYPFYVSLEHSDGLMLGQHVYIEMDMGQQTAKEGIWLGSEFIVQEESGAYVWAADAKEKLEKRAVTLGEFDEALMRYEIQDGLTVEDKIAFPQETLREGMSTSDEYQGGMQGELEIIPGMEEGSGMEGVPDMQGGLELEDGQGNQSMEIIEGGGEISIESGLDIPAEDEKGENTVPEDGAEVLP
jgi:HlyD family secretion protein